MAIKLNINNNESQTKLNLTMHMLVSPLYLYDVQSVAYAGFFNGGDFQMWHQKFVRDLYFDE